MRFGPRSPVLYLVYEDTEVPMNNIQMKHKCSFNCLNSKFNHNPNEVQK